MKNRLQKLWDETVPTGGKYPQTNPKAILQRVDTVLDGTPRRSSRRRLARHAVLLAAVLALLTFAAVAAGQAGVPGLNILATQFSGGTGAVPEFAMSLMNTNPASMSDDNYTITVTSSVTDSHSVHFTLLIEPETEEAQTFLQEMFPKHGPELLRIRDFFWEPSGGEVVTYDPDSGTVQADMHCRLLPLPLPHRVSVRFGAMREGLWLRVPTRTIRSFKISPNAAAPGAPNHLYSGGGPVTLHKFELSPTSAWAKFSSPTDTISMPVFYLLRWDGSFVTPGELHIVPGHGSGSGSFGEVEYQAQTTWDFQTVQDLTQFQAVVYGELAYPLDGGEPYPVDTSSIPFPFVLHDDPQTGQISLAALCEGLLIPYEWQEETRSVTIPFRGMSLTFTEGESAVPVCREDGETVWEMELPAILRDGELWANANDFFWKMDIMTELFDKGSFYREPPSTLQPGIVVIP